MTSLQDIWSMEADLDQIKLNWQTPGVKLVIAGRTGTGIESD
jgi:hypothetical protein